MQQDNNAAAARRWRLDGARALVTGGTKGIGQAIVQELLMLGARVATVARSPDEVTARVAAWQAQGLDASGIAADMTTEAGRRTALDFTQETLGGLDILVNNVGTNIRKASVEYTDDEIARVMDTNLTALFALTRTAHPALKASAQGGGVVNIGSVAGGRGVLSGAPYAMTKAALDQLTRYLAVEWASDNIRVNAVNPWYTRTPLAAPVLNGPTLQRVLARTPNRRVAEAEDISGLVAFLCLPAARHITGQTIAVDGGFLAYGFNPKGDD